MAKPIPTEQMIASYQTGASILEVSREFHVGQGRVRSVLKEAGVLRSRADAIALAWTNGKKSPSAKWRHVGKEISTEDVTEMFVSGMNSSQIAAKLHIGARRVRERLVDVGVLEKIDGCLSCSKPIDGHGAKNFCETCCPDQRFLRLAQKYGVTKPTWDRMLVAQGGHCALCLMDAQVVDHDHETNVVRGLLCNTCNFALHKLDENAEWATKAHDYVRRKPA